MNRLDRTPTLASSARALVLVLSLACASPGGERADEATGRAERPDAAAPGAVRDVPRDGSRRIREPRRPPEAARREGRVDEEHPDEPIRVDGPEDRLAHGRRAGEPRVRRGPERRAGTAHSGARVLFGLMHAHTRISDGMGTPADAFAAARAAGLDFLGVTPHNHAAAENAPGTFRDGVLIATTPALYDATSPVTLPGITPPTQIDSLQAAAMAATASDFVALFGQEFSTISSGNHVNVFQPPDVIDDIADGAYDDLYTDLAASPESALRVVQLNHPNMHLDFFYGGSNATTRGKMFNDYGYDDFGDDFSALVAAANPFVALLEVLSGPAKDPGVHERFTYDGHRLHDRDYYFYLVQGFHLSPSVGQDNHFTNWGTATPARMGVLADDLTAASLIAAMRQNRTFASEDANLTVELTCNGQPMGSVLTVPEGGSLELSVAVTDPDDTDLRYEVDLFYGDVLPATRRDELVKWVPADGHQGSFAFDGPGALQLDEFLASGAPEFFYVRVQQGDGDRAWSAPIWINHPRSR